MQTSHTIIAVNGPRTIISTDQPGPGGAHHRYQIVETGNLGRVLGTSRSRACSASRHPGRFWASASSPCNSHALRACAVLPGWRHVAGRRPRVNLQRVVDQQVGRLLYPEAEAIQALRPKTRADCVGAVRPCPWVGCRHHLYLTVDEKTGAITENFPDIEVWELPHSCALDIADAGPDGMSLEDIGQTHDLTRERTRQIELAGLGSILVEITEPARGQPVKIRTPKHRRLARAIGRLTASLLRLARAMNSTAIRTFVADIEHARGLAATAQVATEYLAGDPPIDVRAIRAIRAIACAAVEPDPMEWPVHLLEMSAQLAELDAVLVPVVGAGEIREL